MAGAIHQSINDYINAQENRYPITIYRDYGGNINHYINATNKYNKEHREVRVIGDCYSACMMSLAVKLVCIYPSAKIYFHLLRNPITNETDPITTARLLKQINFRVYDILWGKIEANFTQNASLSGTQLINLGFKQCPYSLQIPKPTL